MFENITFTVMFEPFIEKELLILVFFTTLESNS